MKFYEIWLANKIRVTAKHRYHEEIGEYSEENQAHPILCQDIKMSA